MQPEVTIWRTVRRKSWRSRQKIVRLDIKLDETDTLRMRLGMRFRGEVETELVSGAIEVGETPLEAAKRELCEEAGLEAHSWTELGVVDPFTTIVRSPNYMFVARGLRACSGARCEDRSEGDELRVIRVPFSEALDAVLDWRITHAATCVAILRVARDMGC